MVSKSKMDFINRKPKKRGYSDPTILISVGAVSEDEGEKLIKQQKDPAGISHNKICLVTGLDHTETTSEWSQIHPDQRLIHCTVYLTAIL